MKSILTGIVLAAIVCGLGYFLLVPKLKEQSYQSGYDKGLADGNAKGLLEGTAAGKEQQKAYEDSLQTAIAAHKADSIQQLPKPAPPKRDKTNYNINYRVVGNQIQDKDQPTSSPEQGQAN